MNLQNFTTSFSFNILDSDDEDEFDFDAELDEEERGPALDLYGTDLTVLAQLGQLEECFGREKELSELMEILVRRQKNNPVLIGDAGVGKTAIVELFANKIVSNLVPFVLEGRTIVSIDLARIVAGSRYRGEFELRFQRLLDEVLDQPHIIIFIDEIHNIGGTGSAEGSLDAANILKPVLSRSGFQCIGATTTKEYQRIEKDPALNRRFQPIKVKEPSIDETVNILYGLRPSLEAFHNVEILPGALKLSADLAARYIYDRFLPDKAIDLIDRASAKEVIRLTSVKEGSLIASLVNASLTHIGALRIEAFRRGDIPSEYIFQEIENSYRNFLLRWIESPLTIEEAVLGEEKDRSDMTPISQELFDTMKISVLNRVDELLFSSCNPRSILKTIKQIKDLSVQKNIEIYDEMSSYINHNYIPLLSTYRISLFLFGEWIEGEQFNLSISRIKENYFFDLASVIIDFGMYDYLCETRIKLIADPLIFLFEKDFCEEDVEFYEEKFEILSQLEENRIDIFADFLLVLQPVLRKGIIESLRSSSNIDLTEQELAAIYMLLGYFSTETGRQSLVNVDDPEMIQRSRKLGDFTGLKKRITQTEIRELLSDITGIPIQTISNAESQKLLNLESTLHQRVIGQEEAISAISKAIRRSRLGIQNPHRPIASFLFCGPTGVGKTEVTKALAVSMFGSESDMIRFDMSEFMEKFSVSRLIGAPPGYVGYDEGGQLTDSVRRKPYSVVLFDEVEKAHPDILNILLQILEDGRLTDSQKRLIPFENTVIIMTSNAAAEEIQQIIKSDKASKASEVIEVSEVSETDTPIFTNLMKTPELVKPLELESKSIENSMNNTDTTTDEIIFEDPYSGPIAFLQSPITENFLTDIRKKLKGEFKKSFLRFKANEILKKETEKRNKILEQKKLQQQTLAALKTAVLDRLSTIFLPEFLNRLDDIIIFQPLKPEELRKICDIMVNDVAERVKPKQILLSVDENVKVKLTSEGYNPIFGARPLRRLITKYIEDLISETILRTPNIKKMRTIKIRLNEDDQISVQKEEEEQEEQEE
jgi:ATP-dependent Clp protease ATP-binding subunit ClpA